MLKRLPFHFKDYETNEFALFSRRLMVNIINGIIEIRIRRFIEALLPVIYIAT